jgi:hypothetical protein
MAVLLWDQAASSSCNVIHITAISLGAAEQPELLQHKDFVYLSAEHSISRMLLRTRLFFHQMKTVIRGQILTAGMVDLHSHVQPLAEIQQVVTEQQVRLQEHRPQAVQDRLLDSQMVEMALLEALVEMEQLELEVRPVQQELEHSQSHSIALMINR